MILLQDAPLDQKALEELLTTADEIMKDLGVWKALAEHRNGNNSELAVVHAILRAARKIQRKTS